MSLTKNRAATTYRTDFMADERAFLVAWGNENGLEVSIKPAVADLAHEMVFVSYDEHAASWVIYRADGYLWLCRIEDRVGHGREGSKMVVDSVEEALATIPRLFGNPKKLLANLFCADSSPFHDPRRLPRR